MLKYYLKYALDVFGIYLFWICMHFVAANLYARYCAELSFFGFFKSPFAAVSMHCKALLFLTQSGSNFLTTMFISIGTYFFSKFCSHMVMIEEYNRNKT